ncbi:MAG: adenylate/guanylate cyclase domain-containing protein [Dehalococcoidia bacterium]
MQDEAARLSEDARRGIRSRASPEGIVTILFTDIVASTRLRQRLGDDAAQELFREHNRILRAQIEKHGGFEVKTYGDGFMVAFTSVVAALACAIDIQRGTAEHNREHQGQELQVRIGLNSGQVIKEEEDFFGSAVVIAARVANLAKGGQILASEVVRGLAGSRPGIRYLHRGRHRLKGLAGSYDIWAVPWREAEARGFARLWASTAFRLIAPVFLLAAIAGGVTGGLVLSQAGGDGGGPLATAPFQEIAVHHESAGTGQRVSGDCVSADLLYRSTSEGKVTGDMSGLITATAVATLYTDAMCQSGLNTATFTITDLEGNTLFGTVEGPVSITRLPGQEASASSVISAVIITGGTGIYEGATGSGTCTSLAVNNVGPDGSLAYQVNSDCRYELAPTGAAAAAAEPVFVQVGASPTAVTTVLGGSVDLPNTVAFVVLYSNNLNHTQKGLSLRLLEPQGAQIFAEARDEDQPPSAGERTWRLPDLPPGKTKRFQFDMQLLSAETSTIPLVVEVEGEGFDQPVTSTPITIRVVQ